MYIYHALINALGAHMIHINLNTIFYTPVEDSPTETIYIKAFSRSEKLFCVGVWAGFFTGFFTCYCGNTGVERIPHVSLYLRRSVGYFSRQPLHGLQETMMMTMS